MSLRNMLTWLVAAVMALALGACADIPTSGPVTEVSATTQGRGVQIAPEPPQKGMAASRIVEGFLQAMADPSGDYQVARQYLTSSARDAWGPKQGTVIYDGWVEAVGDGMELRGTTRGVLQCPGNPSPTISGWSRKRGSGGSRRHRRACCFPATSLLVPTPRRGRISSLSQDRR